MPPSFTQKPTRDPASRYEILRELGRGQSASVWLARDHGAGGSLVAIKDARGDACQDLIHEYRILTTARHALLARPLDLQVVDGQARLVLEAIDGESLAERTVRAPLRDPMELTRLAACLLIAVDRLHGERFLHLDIKPSNVIIRGHGKHLSASLIDGGLGLTFSEAAEPGRAGGTPAFAAPEVKAGVPVDLRADLYSIGRTIRAANSNAPLPEPLHTLCARLDDPDPRGRHETAEAALIAHRQVSQALVNALPFRLPHAPTPSASALVVDRLRAGAPVLLVAPPDSGKTDFLHRLQREFTLRGTPTCSISGRDPTGVLAALKSAYPPSEPAPDLTHAALNADLFDIATTLLARARPSTLFLVDDADHIDPKVQDALLAAGRGALGDMSESPRPAVILAFQRRPVSGPLADAKNWIHLDPPSARDVADCLSRVSAANIPASTLRNAAERLTRASLGRISAIEERVGAAVIATGSWTAAMEHLAQAPQVVASGVRRRLRRKAFLALPEDARELLQLAARAQIPLPDKCLIAATGRPGDLTATTLAELRVRGALERMPNGRLLLAERFIPPMLNSDRNRHLSSMLASGIAADGDPELDAVRKLHRLIARPSPDADTDAARALERLRCAGAARLVVTLARTARRELRAMRLAGFDSDHASRQARDRDAWRPGEVMVELGRAMLDLGLVKEGERVLKSILEEDLSGQTSPSCKTRAALGLAEGSSRHGDLRDARTHAQGAARFIEDTDDPILHAQVANMEAWLFYLAGEHDRSRERAEAALPRVRGTLEEALLLNLAGLANMGAGHYSAAKQALRAALHGFVRAGVTTGAAMVRNNLALVASRAGNLANAARQLAILRREARIGHQPRRAALAANNASLIYRDFGHLNRARALIGEAVRVRAATSDRYGLASSLSNRSTILTELGDASTAIHDAERSVDEFASAGASNEEVTARKNVVRACVALGHDARAEEEILQTLALARRRRLPKEEADVVAFDGHRLARAGKIPEAVAQLRRSTALHLSRSDVRSAFSLDVEICCQDDRLLAAFDQVERRAMFERATDARLVKSFEAHGLGSLVQTRVRAIEAPGALASTSFNDVFRSLARCERPRVLLVAATLAAEAAVSCERTIAAARAVAVASQALDRLRTGAPGQLDDAIVARLATVSKQDGVLDVSTFSGPRQLTSARGRSLDRILELYRQLALARDVEPLLDAILDASLTLVGAGRAFLLVVDDGDDTTVARSRDAEGRLENADDQLSRSILETAIRTGRRLVVGDAAVDPQWSEILSVKRLRLRSVACLPLRAGDRTIGALYVDHSQRSQAFDPDDLDLLERFADQASLALVRIRDTQRIEALNRVLEQRLVRTERALAAAAHGSRMGDHLRPMQRLVGSCPEMTRVRRDLERAAVTDLPLLLLGESGTGKGLAARAVHDASPRHGGPFVVLDGAVISDALFEAEVFGAMKGSFTGAIHDREGLFAEADGGTLFLDQADQLTPSAQARLLRALETGTVRPIGGAPRRFDVRIIAASSADPRRARDGDDSFSPLRGDLYFRLRGVEVTLPPLRRRGDDVIELAEQYLAEAPAAPDGRARTIRRSARNCMLAYSWPGNVRELQSEITRLALSPVVEIGAKDLKAALRTPRHDPGPSSGRNAGPAGPAGSRGHLDPKGTLDARERVRETERESVEQALTETLGNRTRAAALLGLSRQGLLKKMKRLGIQ